MNFAEELGKSYNCAIFGYPAFKPGVKYAHEEAFGHEDEGKKWVEECFVDIRQLDFSKKDWHLGLHADYQGGSDKSYRTQIKSNHKLVSKLDEAVKKGGALMLVPDLVNACCYIGRAEEFGLNYHHEMVKEYHLKRVDHKIDEGKNQKQKKRQAISMKTADLIQQVKVGKFEPIPFYEIPRWISYKLFSRTTWGMIDSNEFKQYGLNAYDTLSEIYDGKKYVPQNDEEKLLARLGPNSFEHFITLLFAWQYADKLWVHTGGSGDGGVDVAGLDPVSKEMKVAVQCKWKCADPDAVLKHLKCAEGVEKKLATLSTFKGRNDLDHLPEILKMIRENVREHPEFAELVDRWLQIKL